MSLLKKCVAPNAISQPLPTCLTKEWEFKVELVDILPVRTNQQGIQEPLVRSKDLPTFIDSWESMELLKAQFLDFPLEDKRGFEGGNVDEAPRVKPRVKNVYNRRNNRNGP